MNSLEDDFLNRLARGHLIEQDEYDQMLPDLPQESIARALAKRHTCTQELPVLVEAARIFLREGLFYDALEACSRAPRQPELRKLILAALPEVQKDYPDIPMVGKLLEDAFLVINLQTGEIVRFPPIFCMILA